jgi:DNA-binding NarL/FixJ family response regulator
MPHTILIADDSSIIREALCEFFEREDDFTVCGEAENGLEAVEKAQQLHPDLILLDLSMPVMNGLDATRVLRRVMPDVPIIMYSAYGDSFTEKESRSAGVWALVSKSEHISVLLGKARGVIEAEDLRAFQDLSASSRRSRSLGRQNSPSGGDAMIHDFQLARGDICEDPTGLRVRVEDVDIYDYIHFSVIGRSDSGEDEVESGQMSHVAFANRFTKLSNIIADRKAA